jgi:RsiW-degrading membrane proteinase PrsW (M82 family)
MLIGAGLLVVLHTYSVLNSPDRDLEMSSMMTGALFALPMLLVYLWVPWIVDRYDPEPAWALLMVLSWGAIGACGISAMVNTTVMWLGNQVAGFRTGEILAICFGAPLVEEFTKGLAVFFMFYVMRREFDGIVDGVIYATFAALGFAAVENILYYGNAAKADMLGLQEHVFAGTFIVRGLLAPWGHPLYTSMTGIGFGIARETQSPLLRWVAPIAGYLTAVFLHATWNMASMISGALVILMFPLWFLFVCAFGVLLFWLIRRKGKIIHDFLQDEVMMGTMTPWEVALVSSPVAALRATFTYGGKAGRKFVAAAARLALSKWHTGRAAGAAQMTLSAGMVLPLRKQLQQLREEISLKLGRPVESPQVAAPGVPPAGA